VPAEKPPYVTAWDRISDTLAGTAVALLVAALET